jgi:hypothetical protein
MKTAISKTSIAFLMAAFFSFSYSSAQLTDMGRLISGGAEDGEKLLEAYLAPFPKAFGATLNAGWYNTAKPHKFLGFDLTFSFNVAMVPDEEKYFDLSRLNLSPAANIIGNPVSPTFSGSANGTRPTLQYTGVVNEQSFTLAEFTLPQGSGIGFIPAPALQLAVGMPFGTEIIGRYTPELKLGNSGNMGLWGVGVKHSIKQWIPVVKRLPVIHLSLMTGYTKFYTGSAVNFLPANINAMDNTSHSVSFNDQKMDFGVGSFTANILGSVDIPFITAYGGIGVNSTTTNLKMTGWYPVPALNSQGVAEVTDDSALKDPIDIRLGGYKGVQPRFTAGMKFKLAIIHLHFDYTYSNYSVVTGGLGVSIR